MTDMEWAKEGDLPSDDDEDGGAQHHAHDGAGGDDGVNDDEQQQQQQQDAEISHLRLQVKQYPNHYESHEQFVQVLRAAGRTDELRHAREKFSEAFPLPESIWLQWLEDEQAAIDDQTSRENKERLIKLFERALADFTTPTLWTRYLVYATAEVDRPDAVLSTKDVETLFERAITSTGSHMTEGTTIWTMYILFEATHKEDTLVAMQKIYRRQLAVPHLSYQETLDAYEAFETQRNATEKDAIIASLRPTIEKAKRETEARRQFEETLEEQPKNQSMYLTYIDFEQHQKPLDALRVRLLFERALAQNSLQAHVWIKYTTFMDQHMRVPSVLLNIHRRATRNCGWSGDIWGNYLRALERANSPKTDIDDAYRVGRSANFQSADELAKLHLAYIDYLRRQSETNVEARASSSGTLGPAFDNATDHIVQYFGGSDPYGQLERYLIRLEALHWNNLTKARELYEELLKRNPRYADQWLEFAQMERMLGNPSVAQALYRRAVVSRCDDMRIFSEALSFEREEGTLESFDQMSAKVQTQMAILEQMQNKEVEKAEKAATEANAKKTEKRKRGGGTGQDEGTGGSKRTKTAHTAVSDEHGGMDVDTAASPKPEPPKNPYRDSDLQERMVFVSNLNFGVNEERLRKVFSPCGEIVSVTLVRDPRNSNASKGYGHIEFQTKEAVEQACKRDRERLDGRPVFVSKFVSARRGARREQYPTTADEKTVFVSHLHMSVNDKVLEDAFKQFGEIKQVRLAIRKSGMSKGFAYVEFADEMAARRALAMDDKELGGQKIAVQMSNPPAKKEHPAATAAESGADAGTSVSFGQRRGGPTNLIPRQLLRVPGAVPASGSTIEATTTPGKKSQDDFRKMLMGKGSSSSSS